MSSRGRRGKGRGRGRDREKESERAQGWETTVNSKRSGGFSAPPPPGLKGRAIGMYYRNLHRKKNESEGRDDPNGARQKEEELRTVKLTLPPAVVYSLKVNLCTIMKTAKNSNIKIPFSNFEDKIEKKAANCNNSAASTSKNPVNNQKQGKSLGEQAGSDEKDFIMEISDDSDNSADEDSKNDDFDRRLLSFKGAGDYKYSYVDIITGTFQEKLDESIELGVTITTVNEQSKDLDIALHYEHIDARSSNSYNKMLKFREQLPAYKKSKEILDVVNNNQVVVISGETGCGKSTQVPQMILDEAISNKRGSQVKILVTQPRRIAAISLATRVAEERNEAVGKSVGYLIRLERQDCRPRGSIMFCTTGVLLSELEVNQGLTNYSHVILDEVHERDCHIDISMCMLKQVLKKRPDLKVILMSATLDAEKLSKYFDDCPMLHIEGLAYPVQDIYLEDILAFTEFQLPEDYQRNPKKHESWKVKKETMEKEIQYRAEISGWLESKRRCLENHVYRTLLDYRIEILNTDLVLQLLNYLCKSADSGAILVFLPGIADITALLRKMDESKLFPRSRFEVHPLHSKLPTLEQRKIFERPPNGVRKIIVATNIAETSITIDDIVYVIDSGRIKISGLDVEKNVSTLNVQWVSQANLRQRRGRAGRCQPGICYHLFTSFRASKLDERLLPEIQRSNLLEPVLQIKKLRLGKAEDAMSLMAEPPAPSAVQWAVDHLKQSGALNVSETLTPLGWHLARLPVHPAAGKLLLFGALFGCLDRAASVAAIWGFKDPFQMVIGKEREVDEKKRLLAMGEPSDHVAMSQALYEWEKCYSYSSKRNFAYENFLSNNTLELLSQMKKQFGESLKQMAFLENGDVKSSWENRNTENVSLFKAVVAAALYPNIASVKWPGFKVNRFAPLKVFTPDLGRVKIHPSSVMAQNPRAPRDSLCSNPGANWLVYWMKQQTTELYLIDVTLVYSLPLMFFGEMKITEGERRDECYWNVTKIRVNCKKKTAKLLFILRSMLDYVLATKVMSSRDVNGHSKFEEQVLNAVIELITAQDEEAEYLYLGDYSESDHSELDTSY